MIAQDSRDRRDEHEEQTLCFNLAAEALHPYDSRFVRSFRTGVGFGVRPGEKAAEAPRSGKGEIVVTSRPEGAVVIFNGNPRGEAYRLRPVEIKGVDYGRHSIRAEFPGYVGQILEFDVRAKKTSIEMRLTKDGAGRLVVRSDPPGAEVFIGSRYYGKADPAIEVTNLAPGEYSIWLRLAGHGMERRNVIVERRRERRYMIVLDKAP